MIAGVPIAKGGGRAEKCVAVSEENSFSSSCALVKRKRSGAAPKCPSRAAPGADIPEMSVSTIASIGLLVKSSLDHFSEKGHTARRYNRYALRSRAACGFPESRERPFFLRLAGRIRCRGRVVFPSHLCRLRAGQSRPHLSIAAAAPRPRAQRGGAARRGPRRVPAPARHLRHARPDGQVDLRRQGQVVTGPVAQLLPPQQSRRQGGAYSAKHAHPRLGNLPPASSRRCCGSWN